MLLALSCVCYVIVCVCVRMFFCVCVLVNTFATLIDSAAKPRWPQVSREDTIRDCALSYDISNPVPPR